MLHIESVTALILACLIAFAMWQRIRIVRIRRAYMHWARTADMKLRMQAGEMRQQRNKIAMLHRHIQKSPALRGVPLPKEDASNDGSEKESEGQPAADDGSNGDRGDG